MNHKLIQYGFGAATTALLLTAPAVAAGQGELQTVVRGPEGVQAHGALTQGEGSGRISIPTVTSQGQMVGMLTDNGSFDRYLVQATLTSFLPKVANQAATTGGVYGKLIQLDSNGQVLERKWLYIDGTWTMTSERTGILQASMLTDPRLGTPQLIGRIEGKFAVGIEGQPETAAFSAAADVGERRTTDFQTVRDVQGGKDIGPFQSARDELGDKRRVSPWQSVRDIHREDEHRDASFHSAGEAGGERTNDGGAVADARSASEDGGTVFTTPIALQFVLAND